MRTYFHRHHVSTGSTIISLMQGGLSRLVDADRCRRERVEWQHELESIMDADEFRLRDMGLTREEICARLSALRRPS